MAEHVTKLQRLQGELEKNRSKQAYLKEVEKDLLARIRDEERSEILCLVHKHKLSPAALRELLQARTDQDEATQHIERMDQIDPDQPSQPPKAEEGDFLAHENTTIL